MQKSTGRKRAMAVTGAVLALAAAIGMVVTSGAAPSPSAVRLHMAGDGKYFAYGSATQPLTNSSGCKIGSAESLIDISTGSGTDPGLGSNGLGVKSGSSNGTPCSQVDKYETLKLKRGPGLGSRRFTGVRLDVEMTGNAVVKLTLASSSRSETYLLKTGTSIIPSEADDPDYDLVAPYLVSSGPGDVWDACAAPNASGPNSGGNDNCLWTVQPGFVFDSLTLTTLKGTVALEGAGDFGGHADFETLLYLDNSAPTAANDTFSTAEDTPLTGNVLANDADLDGTPLAATLLSGPSHGTLAPGGLASTGGFTYVPNPNYHGPDSFTYRASDGLASSNATVNITVTAVNDPPVPTTTGATTNEDSSVDVTVATDVDSTEGTTLCTLTSGGTSYGGVVDRPGFVVRVTPPTDFVGTLTLTCTVTDAGGASAETQTSISVGVLSVNDPPVAVNDAAEVNEDDDVSIDVIDNDLDVDGDSLSVAAGSITNVLPAGASAVVDALSGDVVYTPPAGYSGPGSFQYRATDGHATSGIATVTVDVLQVVCGTETVTDADGAVTGAFTLLDEVEVCKEYDLDATQAAGGTVIFAPEGGTEVIYRGVLTFPGDPRPAPGGSGQHPLLLRYDPTGGTTFRPVQWCFGPTFVDGLVVTATLPGAETWCVASASTVPNTAGELVTTWQVYGEDDPRFSR